MKNHVTDQQNKQAPFLINTTAKQQSSFAKTVWHSLTFYDKNKVGSGYYLSLKILIIQPISNA